MASNKMVSRRRPKRRGKQAAVSIQAARNRPAALRLKIQGLSSREIGRRLGVSHVTAEKYVRHELARGDISADERRVYRELERERLEFVLQRVMALVTRLDVVVETTKEGRRGPVKITVEDFQAGIRAAEIVVKISARLAALYGLDAPKKTELNGADGQSPALTPDLETAILKAYGEAAADGSPEKIVAFPAAAAVRSA